MKKLLITLFLGFLATTAPGAEGDPGFTEIPPKELPRLIIEVAQKELPEYRVDKAILEKDGSGIYSLAMHHKTVPGQCGTLNIDSKGELSGKSVDVKESALPEGVVEALKKKYKEYISLKIIGVSHSVEFDKGERKETYSLQLYLGVTLSRFVTVDKSGKIISDMSEEEFDKTIVTEE
ncbi:MAG: hypothetical protein V4733_12650 [Verrucomicrobiota bacterium]